MGFQQGLSGLNTSAKQLDVIGNNVANASTVGFKQGQAQFADMYAASLSGGGGLQIGTGVKLAAVAQQFSQGNVTNTNNVMDTAISGGGFFQMVDQSGAILYSRNGQFQVDKTGFIVNNQGHQVMGFQATAGTVTAQQGPLKIDPSPLLPKQTSNLAAGGAPIGVGANLDARVKFPLGITQGTISGNTPAGLTISNVGVATPGTVTAAAPLTNFDYSTNSVGFNVSGTPVLLNANYATVAGVVGAIQTQLDAAVPGTYVVSEVAGVLSIATTATNVAAPVIGAYNGNVDGLPTIVPDMFAGGVSATMAGAATSGAGGVAAAVNNLDYSVNPVSFTVDGLTITLDGLDGAATPLVAAPYASAADLAGAINAKLTAVAAGVYSATASPAGVITIAKVATGTPAPALATFIDINAAGVVDEFTGGLVTAAAGAVTAGAAANFNYATNSISFNVDAAPVLLNANYTNVAGVVGAIQTQLDAASAGTYAVSADVAGVITIAKTATGTPAPVIAAYNGDVDGLPTIVPDMFAGATSVAGAQGANDTFTVAVDGIGPVTVTIPLGAYTTTAALASAVQAAVNADPVLTAAGKSVSVSVGVSGNLVMASSSGGVNSSLVVADVVPGTLSNLFGTAAPVAGAGTFNTSLPDTYNNSTSLTIYDSQGNQHIASLYFQKASPNTWNSYLAVDSAVVPATGTPLATLNFDTAGRLISVTPTAPATQGITGKIVISDPSFVPTGTAMTTLVNPMPLGFDFSQTTQYGGAFSINSLTQDGYTSGDLSGFSTGVDGTIVGRYTNGQSQALGRVGLVNFTNPQGLQPVGNNEWVETPQAGIIPLNTPGTGGLGLLQSSAVEDSNVDLTAELVNMITAQRVYQANAQTIKTQDAVLQTIVNLR